VQITIEINDEVDYPLSEAECLKAANGTVFKCRSGDLFMLVRDYAYRDRGPIMIMMGREGPAHNINGSWTNSGYRGFKLVGNLNIEFKWPKQ